MDVDLTGSSVSDNEGTSDNAQNGNIVKSQCEISLGGKLKRSSSAPMIHQLVPQIETTHSVTSTSNSTTWQRDKPESHSIIEPRARRLSANFGPVSPLSPGSSRIANRMRVCQLREEEGMDIVGREAAHERTIQSSLQMAEALSQSCEDLALSEDSKSNQQSTQFKKDFSDQLSLSINTPSNTQTVCSGSSPTRVGRQCFSPSLQQPVRNYSFCPTPSPTKRSFTRRSLSPIPLRPSPLGSLKRKCDMEDSFATPSKRLSTATPDRCIAGLLITNPHSSESSPSPLGRSVGTPESICSSVGSPNPPISSYSPAQTPDPPAHLFKPLSPALSQSHPNFGHSRTDFSPGTRSSDEDTYNKVTSSLGSETNESCDVIMSDIVSTNHNPRSILPNRSTNHGATSILSVNLSANHDSRNCQSMDFTEPVTSSNGAS